MEMKNKSLFFHFALILLLFIIFLSPCLFAQKVSRTDYKYESDYVAPIKPEPIALNCSFFYPGADTSCASLDKVPNSSRQSMLLGIIRRLQPEENQDWIRFWNSRLNVGRYYENASLPLLNISDGQWAQNGSLKNAWVRLIDIYPSVFFERDNVYYTPDQALVRISSNVDFVVPTPKQGYACMQQYDIGGYEFSLQKEMNGVVSDGTVLPVSQMLAPSESANMSISFFAKGSWGRNISMWENETTCEGRYCQVSEVCRPNSSEKNYDTLNLSFSLPIKRYPDTFEYENRIAVPKSGFAKGDATITLPRDFLYYQIIIKGQSYMVRKNDLKITARGGVYPILQINMISAPANTGNLHITMLNESDDENSPDYTAEIRYKVLLDSPNLSESDCRLIVATPFELKEINSSCQTARESARIKLYILNVTGGSALIAAMVTDQLGNPMEGADVEFSGALAASRKKTDADGVALLSILQRESTNTLTAKVLGTQDVAEAQDVIFVPGKGAGDAQTKSTTDIVGQLAPIFLILAIVSFLVMRVMKKKENTAWALLPILLLAVLFLLPAMHAQELGVAGSSDLQATIEACKNYDFDNAVRHFGECAESYQLSTEFASMRRTASVLVDNIAPLVVANPDIAPYKPAYVNMVLIALSLFRVAWAFNSLYLLLNIFNPEKRSEALKQYAWLIVFVIFAYASYSIVQDSISAVNSISQWIVGSDASSTLSQATLSTEFVAENYEMLKLVLPFLSLSYLILLARYITVIGMVLFFPFTLLLFFTSATRGFGRAALTITFASFGLGVLNAILLLIYNILLKSADPALSGSFASTFFSASFIIFFGFVNLLVLSIAFLSGIVFIGREK